MAEATSIPCPTHSAGSPLVVLLDLNETLIYRSDTEIEGCSLPCRRVRHNLVYARPGAQKLIDRLSSSFRVFACTSMIEANAEAALAFVYPEHEHVVDGVLARSYTKEDPTWKERRDGKSWDTIRDTAKILSLLAPSDGRHIVFVDNDRHKCLEAPRNCLVVPEFGVNALRSGSAAVLDALATYLLSLAAFSSEHAETFDVREYLDKHPFTLVRDEAVVGDGLARLTLDEEPKQAEKGEARRQVERALGGTLADCELLFVAVEENLLHMHDRILDVDVSVVLPLAHGRIKARVSLRDLLDADLIFRVCVPRATPPVDVWFGQRSVSTSARGT